VKHAFNQEAMLGSRKIRCALVHDHILLRQGLRRLLEDDPEIEIISESENSVEALKRVLEHRPEIVIADVNVFGFTPEKLELLLRRLSPSTRVLFLSMEEESRDRETRSDMSCAVKNTSAQELVEKIKQAYSERGVVKELTRESQTEWFDAAASTHPRGLTLREREVLKLLAEGRTVRSAASELGVSTKTVDAHKFNLMRKIGIHNKAELVMWAIRKRLVRVPSNL
jgi:two-component system, NarL family, response regulator NreC